MAEIVAAVAYLASAWPRACADPRLLHRRRGGRGRRRPSRSRPVRREYTLDGLTLGEIEAETFNAWKVADLPRPLDAPGHGQGQPVNAIKLAADFVASLPRDGLSPETTEEREGFVHPTRISGGAEEAAVELIVRPRPRQVEEHIALLRRLAAEVGEERARASVGVSEEEQYRNMGR